jgi:HEAT repeat protein/ATP/ADP translocase
MNRLVSLLKVRAEEVRLVTLVALFFACIQAGQGLGDNSASALFLLRFGVDFLPYMFIAAGALTFVVTVGYSAGLGRFQRGRFFPVLILASAALILIERFAIIFSFSFLYPTLWLTMTCLGGLLGTLVWNLAGEVCDARQAKRLFPLFTSAGILGSVAGNAITGPGARLLGTDNLLLLYAALLVIAHYLARSIAASYLRKEKLPAGKASLLEDLRAGYDFVRTSSLLRLVAVASILFSVLFFAVSFPFSKVVTASFQNEAGVAGFFGLFNSITTASTFLVSLFLANRLYARLGIINGVFLMPLTYVLCFTVFAARYDLAGGGTARFAQLVILGGIAGTAWNALFNVVPSQKRGQVLAFVNGIPSQLGVMLSGALLIIADQALTVRQIFLMGGLLALVCGALVWRMRAAYAQALVDALRAGRLEVFTLGEGAFSGFQGDAAALQVATQALQDPKATTRRLAAQVLGKMGSVSAIRPLIEQLSDPDGNVRSSVLEALGALQARDSLDPILLHLDDPEEEVRCQALSVIAQLQPLATPIPTEKLENMLSGDPSFGVQVQAARALMQLGLVERVLPNLMVWLYSRELAVRIKATETLAEAAPYLKIPLESRPLLNALEDASPALRRAAAFAMSNLADGAVSEALVAHLDDPDVSVRAAAAESLRKGGDESRSLVLQVFEKDNPTIDSALDAIVPGDPQALPTLRRFAQREVVRARTLRNQLASLPSAGPAVGFLRARLRERELACEWRLIRIVGLFGDMRAMDLVRKSMGGGSAETRAAALEALDTIGDRQIAKSIVALLEDEPAPSATPAVIDQLIGSSDAWQRILAVRSLPELGLREFIPLLHHIESEPDLLLREAAHQALSEFDEEEPMDTLKTVSLLERVLLLREIPIFADLSAEDLKRIAEIAQEQWYPKDSIIFRQGEDGDAMYVIVEGRVQIRHNTGGRELVRAERGPGDFVGEMAIIESAPRSASLFTQTEVRVLSLDAETFRGILRERPDVAFAVLRSVSRRLREMTEGEIREPSQSS